MADSAEQASGQQPSASANNAFQPHPDSSPASSGQLGTPDSAPRALPQSASTPHGGVIFPPIRTGSGGLNPRSCVTCRRRKVRCDKQQPCSNCVRQHIPCQFPAPGRAPRRPRKPPDGELLARLRKLEGVVQSLGASADDDEEDDGGHVMGTITDRGLTSDPMEYVGPSEERKRMLDYMVDHERKSLNSTFGRLVLDDGKSRYISNSFWANLSNEIEDIKSILHDEEGEEEHDITPPLSPEMADESFIWGHPSPASDLHQSHPPAPSISVLIRIFEDNVEPVMKLFHQPSIREQIEKYKNKPGDSPRGLEALMFAIYYAAVTSLSPEECQSMLSEPKSVLQPRYRHGTERALARANFLRTEELIVLQAFVLFISSLRRNEDPRVLWTIVGLLTRIAISMGLHRDPSLFGLSPFDTEIRRRLWWHVCNLDVRLSEDHGSDPTILEHTFDTKLPLNINDDEFKPDMPSTTTDRKGITDMTFCLIRFEVANTFRRLSYQPPLTGKFHDRVQEVTVQDKQRWIEECHKNLEEKYLRYSDKNIPMHWVVCTVGRLVLAKMWLSLYQPFQTLGGPACLPQQTRDQLFSTSIESIEYAIQLENEISTMKWNWIFKSYSQWHAMAFLLNELCVRTKGPLVVRAWRAVDIMLDAWQDRIAPHKRDHIWRPLRKLVAKARAARKREVMNQKGPGSGLPQNGDWSGDVSLPSGGSWNLGSGNVPASVNQTQAQNTGQNQYLALTPNWNTNDIDTQMRAADSRAPAEQGDLATTPFFANQPPASGWATFSTDGFNTDDANIDLVQDVYEGSSSFPPVPGPSNARMPPPSQSRAQSQGQTQSASQTPPMFGTRTDEYLARASDGKRAPEPSFAGMTGLASTNTAAEANGINGGDPMLSGADIDLDGDMDVQWDDWDTMAREYELEAGQTVASAPAPSGLTPGGAQFGAAGYFGGAPQGGRRAMLGENWF